MTAQTPEQRRNALAFNAVGPVLKEHDQWLPLSVRKAVAEAVLAAIDSDTQAHVYLSTGCLHGEHEYCQSMTGQQGRKRPAECKFCQARCVCPCHDKEG